MAEELAPVARIRARSPQMAPRGARRAPLGRHQSPTEPRFTIALTYRAHRYPD